jgi:plasmid stabilization system protein ParE
MRVRFLEVARRELAEAIDYYDGRVTGLGFESKVQRAVLRISDHPRTWSRISERIRRCATKRFPYAVLYQVREDELLVVAVMHLHRDPVSWRDRFPEE